MLVSERRTKARREPVASASSPPNDGPASPLRLLDAAFKTLALSLSPDDVPDVVRRNRRERAKRRLRDALETRGDYPITESLHAEMQQLISRWARKGFVDAFPDADEFEIRCAEERTVLDAAASGNERERFAATERAYLREIEKKHGHIEIRGLQLSARVYQDLEIAYVPLHIEMTPSTPPEAARGETEGDRAQTAMSEMALGLGLGRLRIPAPRAVGMYARLLLLGAPGSGKSTLLAYFAARAARGRLAEDAGLTTNPIPFVVPVRSLHSVPTDIERLAQSAGADPWFLKRALQDARACFFVDGLDEARTDVAGKLLDGLEAVLRPFPEARVIVTSRPAGVPGGDIPAPAHYARGELLSMTREDVTQYIKQWCLAAELSLSKARDQAENDALIAAEDLMERVRASRAIEKLAQTPLLCSVICIVHRFLGQRIPERRVVLYDAITNVLLFEWDHAKFPEGAATGKLDAHAKRSLLACLARDMHDAHVAEISADALVDKFAQQLPHLGHSADDAARIVAEIRDRNGILVERSPGQFAFSHLTFQEYLTAFHIVNARDFAMLVRKYHDKWWHEVIVLAAGFPGANAELIVRGLLRKDGERIATGTMLAAQCVETAIELPSTLRSEIETRVAMLIPPKTTAEFAALHKMGDVAAPVLFRALKKADADGKVSILILLAGMRYEPVIGVIGRALTESAPVGKKVPVSPKSTAAQMNWTTAQYAMVAASWMLYVSDAAYVSFLGAMRTAAPEVRYMLQLSRSNKVFPDPENRIPALIDEYDRTHPKDVARAPSPKRAARSG